MKEGARVARVNGRTRAESVDGGGEALVHRDGHRVRFLKDGIDEGGEYLVIEHVWARPGLMAGPHWHPVLTESFVVEEGRMRIRVDGRDFFLGPGERVTVRPGQVHRFRNKGGEGRLVMVHEVRPPLRHRRMFELWHRLDLAGKTTRQGVPKDPLALGLLWELQDGYVAGVPAFAQRLVFGGLARLARLIGYRVQADMSARVRRTSARGLPRWLGPANRLVVALQRVGLVIGPMRLLSIPGRKSGKMHTTPVSPLVVSVERYIVAVFGAADWVKHARVAGWGMIARGRKRKRVTLVEIPPPSSAPRFCRRSHADCLRRPGSFSSDTGYRTIRGHSLRSRRPAPCSASRTERLGEEHEPL